MARESTAIDERWGGSARRLGRSDSPASRGIVRGVVLASLVGVTVGGCSQSSAPPATFSDTPARSNATAQKASSLPAQALTGPGKMQLAAGRRTPDGWVVVGVRREMEGIQGIAQHRVDVSSQEGIVTIAGTVSTAHARSLLLERALAVEGVRAIVNRVEIAADEASDLDVAEQVRRRLRDDPMTAHQSLRVTVEQGVVRLEGSLRISAERKLVERAVQSVRGVRAVDNLIALTASETRPDDILAEEIAQRLARERNVRGAQIAVRVSGGSVFLTGEVKSAFERREVRGMAWLPGVHAVYDEGVRVILARDHLRDPALPPPDDATITRAVADAVRLDPRLLGTSIEVTTKDGVVTLEGVVADPMSRAAAERNARAAFGARSVENDIRVQSGEPVPDDRLEVAEPPPSDMPR